MITASMSTVAWRRPALEQMLPTILPQVDRLNVFLQGYDSIPEFLRHPKITIVDGRDQPQWLALKSTAKLFWIAQGLVADGIHLCVDDDILYPPGYAGYCAAKIGRYQNRAIVGFHGALYNAEVGHIYRDRTEWHYGKACAADIGVHTIGSGTIAWHTSALRLTLDDLPDWDAVDYRIGIAAQKQQVPMVCLSRDAGYLKSLPLASDTRSCSGHSEYTDRILGFYREWSPWRVHQPTAALRDRPVVVVMPCYRESRDRLLASVDSALAVPGVDLVRVVDDCSPDPVAPIDRPRVELIRRGVNGGPSAAMNTGIRTLREDAIICRLDVGDSYHAEAKARQIEAVRRGDARALCSGHYDPVRHFTRTLDQGWQRAIYSDNQFASTTGVYNRDVWVEVGGFDDTKRWTDDWAFAVKVQFLVGWKEFPETTGDHGMWPGGHSDVSGNPARKAARDADMTRTANLARALGSPRQHAHLFDPTWCKKRGLEPLKMPRKIS
jgi:hypothetical protein